jgi:hypothetical protein
MLPLGEEKNLYKKFQNFLNAQLSYVNYFEFHLNSLNLNYPITIDHALFSLS